MTAPLNDALGTRGAVLLVRTRDEPAFDDADQGRRGGRHLVESVAPVDEDRGAPPGQLEGHALAEPVGRSGHEDRLF